MGAQYDLQMECMVNHISPASKEFQDYLAKGDESEFKDLFIDWNKLWGGAHVKQIMCRAVPFRGLGQPDASPNASSNAPDASLMRHNRSYVEAFASSSASP